MTTPPSPDLRLSVNLPAVYTAAHLFSGIPIIKNITLHNVPEDFSGDLAVEINGRASSGDIISFKTEIKDFCPSDCMLCGSDVMILSLEKYRILPDRDIVSKLTINTPARIDINVTLGESTASFVGNIKISPFGHVCPEMPPELLCTYVLPDCEFAVNAEKKLASIVKTLSEKHGGKAPRPLLYAQALASVMLEAKLSYSASMRECFDGDCIIRDPDIVTGSNKRNVSMTEAALLYCSCAERCGLRPGIVFLRKGAGSIKVLISIGMGDYYAGSPVSESISELRKRILDREMFIFDVLGLLGTEDTDFAKNVTETTNLVLRSSSTLSFSVDVYTSRLCGVASLRPFDGASARDIYGGYESISDAVKRIDKNADAVSLYGYSPYTITSLGLCIGDVMLPFGSEYALLPLDDELICQEPDSLLSFSGFRPKNLIDPPRNNKEKTAFDQRLSELTRKVFSSVGKGNIFVYPSKYMLSGEKTSPERIRDEMQSDCVKLCDSVRMAACNSGNTLIYAAVGIVKLSSEDGSFYAPCAYVPCNIFYDGTTPMLRYGTGKPVINRSLREYTSNLTGADFSVRASELVSATSAGLSPEKNGHMRELELCLDIYRSICEDFPDQVVFINNSFLCAYDLSFTLMRDCLERADGKRFEQFLESGKYIQGEDTTRFYGRFEATLPFDAPSESDSAVKAAEKGSVIISGVHGTGKKKTVANIIARAALADDDILVLSKYSESLDSVYDTMKECGIEGLCLKVTDNQGTKTQILSDIKKLSENTGFDTSEGGDDAAILEHSLALYADDIYSEFGFGKSLYDCINDYCTYDLICGDEPIELSAELRDLSRESVEKLFDISERLTESARKIYGMCIPGINDISGYLRYIKNTNEITKTISALFADTEEQLDIFAQRSSLARKCLGIGESAITDVRTLLALGEFLELVMQSGIDILPEELLSGSTFRSAREIEKACDIIDAINALNSELSEVSDRIASISCTELYIKWRDAENNPFVRNSISHEIRKYLPEKSKPGSKETEEILRKLSEREKLRNELSHVSSSLSGILGELRQGTDTDTEKARRIAAFAQSADICIKKLFRNDVDSADIRNGISGLLSTLSQDTEANADFVRAVGAFRKLSSENRGLFAELSRELCCDLYELVFEGGILGKTGMSGMLHSFRDNIEPLFYIHELNTVKKEAINAGLAGAAAYIETHGTYDNALNVIKKSLYLSFAKYIMASKTYPEGEALFEKYTKFGTAHAAEKKTASANLISLHVRRYSEYIADDEGKNELYALRETLIDNASTVYDILSKHKKILHVMYSAVLATTFRAYGFGEYPSTMILLDCEKTDAAEGLPLCANFDKCIFVTSPLEMIGSIMSSLPLGIPEYRLTRVLCGKNGNSAAFVKSLYRDIFTVCCPERSMDNIHFIKCGTGLYDKNTGANRPEAIQVCETAVICAQKYGLEKVGIVAMTAAQTAEISASLSLFANKYKDDAIRDIPVRFIGSMGDFSKECIILSVSFGKNIYSVTRSFGITDDISLLHGKSPMVMSELCACGKELYVVSSAEPEDIMTDNLCKGAGTVASLLAFAKYGAVPFDLSCAKKDTADSGIVNALRRIMAERFPGCAVRCSDGIITAGDSALIYERGYVRDVYDRILLPLYEAERKGYDAKFTDICSLLG